MVSFLCTLLLVVRTAYLYCIVLFMVILLLVCIVPLPPLLVLIVIILPGLYKLVNALFYLLALIVCVHCFLYISCCISFPRITCSDMLILSLVHIVNLVIIMV